MQLRMHDVGAEAGQLHQQRRQALIPQAAKEEVAVEGMLTTVCMWQPAGCVLSVILCASCWYLLSAQLWSCSCS